MRLLLLVLISIPTYGCEIDNAFAKQLRNIDNIAKKAESAEKVKCYRNITIPVDGSSLETGWVCKTIKQWKQDDQAH